MLAQPPGAGSCPAPWLQYALNTKLLRSKFVHLTLGVDCFCLWIGERDPLNWPKCLLPILSKILLSSTTKLIVIWGRLYCFGETALRCSLPSFCVSGAECSVCCYYEQTHCLEMVGLHFFPHTHAQTHTRTSNLSNFYFVLKVILRNAKI